jgi:methylglutaconyl-CoA hydratase
MARPDTRNAFNPEMIADLREVFEGLASPELHGRKALDAGGPPRVVVLAGEGRIFSAGADLAWMRSMATYSLEENRADADRLAALFRAIRDCPLPVIGRIQGAAMGGGSGLVAACDIAVAAADCRFAFSEARLGIVPAVISPFVLPRIGPSAARELFLTGEIFDADRARAIGLLHRVVDAAELDAAVAERVDALLPAGPQAQAAIKRLIPYVAAQDDSEASRDFTARLIAERRASSEGQEGMAAFLERRAPAWLTGEEPS